MLMEMRDVDYVRCAMLDAHIIYMYSAVNI